MLREKCRPSKFENRVLRRIFVPKRESKNLHNAVLNYLNYSPSIVQVIKLRWMKWTQHITHMKERRDTYRVLVEKPERKRPL
jgi:hypothetical protein